MKEDSRKPLREFLHHRANAEIKLSHLVIGLEMVDNERITQELKKFNHDKFILKIKPWQNKFCCWSTSDKFSQIMSIFPDLKNEDLKHLTWNVGSGWEALRIRKSSPKAVCFFWVESDEWSVILGDVLTRWVGCVKKKCSAYDEGWDFISGNGLLRAGPSLSCNSQTKDARQKMSVRTGTWIACFI